MKKIILLLICGALAISCAYSQTYYYKCVESIDENGARSKSSGGGGYITFTNGKQTCYHSDENGYKTKSNDVSDVFLDSKANKTFRKTQQGTHVYDDAWVENMSIFGSYAHAAGNFFYFSSDYSQLIVLNLLYGGSKLTHVYKRTDGPYEEDENIPVF
jgi:hypothetical protein